MTASSLSDDSLETISVSMSDANSVISAGRKSPGGNAVVVEDRVVVDPIEDTRPGPIGAFGVILEGGRVTGTRDLYCNVPPTMRKLEVRDRRWDVAFEAVESCDHDHARDWGARRRMLWYADEC